ncbi:DUF4393 domain-containing protein [Enterococcus saccharolyticus]|uniref:DUF4393 domain-containing protein n=1 Tax=Enterococcus saccharolyticus TaxID=41997 RepID=UPI0039E08C81
MDFVGFSLWFASLPESVKENLVGPASQTAGKGLNGIVTVFANPLIKLGMLADKDIKDYEKKLYSKTQAIPEENRDSSKQGLAIQALEDSLYRISEEEIVELYSNLIAKALDNRTSNRVHPSFTSILKEMSISDAILFKKIITSTRQLVSPYLPIANMQYKFLPNGGYGLIFKDTLIIPEHEQNQLESDTVSIFSLERLGLIKVYRNDELHGPLRLITKQPDGTNIFVGNGSYEDCYLSLYQTDKYKDFLNNKQSPNFPNISEPSLIRGRIELTDFASRLGSIIIPIASQ